MIQLGYFTLDTVDMDKARAFYSGLFGWSFDDDTSRPSYAHVTDSQPPFGFTKVERKTDYTNLYFRVEDVVAACARVNELGGRAAVPSESSSGLSAAVCDDQGMCFSLWQAAEGY